MNVTVIKDSVIYNGKIYAKDESFEANDLIGKSLIERGYVAEVDEAKVLTGHLDKTQLEEMSYNDLKALASQMDLSAKGSKAELIERICGAEVSVDEDAVDEETTDEMPDTSMPE